jgi:2-dehydropantoate 2-reductase
VLERRDMKILIAGAGAVGGVVGAHLARNGREVTLLARPARAQQLRELGLRVTAGHDTQVVWPRVATADQLTAPYDLILLAVKADALPQVMDDIAPAVGADTVIAPFLNGIRHKDALAGRCRAAMIGGAIRVVVQLDDDGTIVQLAPAVQIEVGELDGSSTARLDRVVATLDVPGVEVRSRHDIVDAMWSKWVFIASIGAVTSLMRAPVGDIVAVPGGAAFAEAVLAEAAGVAQVAGHAVAEVDLAATRAVLTAAGSPMTSSMSRDLVAGRYTEVDSVLDDLCERARGLGIHTLSELAALVLRVHNRRVLHTTD